MIGYPPAAWAPASEGNQPSPEHGNPVAQGPQQGEVQPNNVFVRF